MAITNNVGSLKIQITNNNFFPVEGASVYISPTGMPDSTSEEFVTDENGIVIDEELPAPDVAYSLEPGDNQPYSEYNVLVNAYGYNERFISGVQIFSGENGIQNIELTPSDGSNTNPTVLDAHTTLGTVSAQDRRGHDKAGESIRRHSVEPRRCP